MSAVVPFQPMAELFERSLSIRHVYGEPVHHGDLTVIPVAQVAYGFGGGMGRPGRGRRPASSGTGESDQGQPEGGGGGGARLTPVGAIEIGPHGTRFIPYRPMRPLVRAFAIGLAAGLIVGRRRGA